MESMKSILPGLILLASVFAYISYGRSKSGKKEYGSLPPNLICGIIGDYGCAAKCTILCAVHECESVRPRCEGHYCNCYEKSSSNAAPVVSWLPNDQNYELQRTVLKKVSSHKREGTRLQESVARCLRDTIEDFQDGPERFIDIRNSTSLLVSDFEANELDTYVTDESDRSNNYRQDEKAIRRINGFTGRRLLQIDEPVTPAMTVGPIARKVKIERIKKWRKKARMGGPDEDDEESEEVEPVPSSPPPKPAEKRRVKIKQPSAENLKLMTDTGKNDVDDAIRVKTDFTAETFAVPREIPQHEGENNPEFEGQPPAIEPEDIRHPSIEDEIVLMEKESTAVEEHRDPVENQEIVVDSPKNETALVKPRVKKSRKKTPKPTKSGPKIQRVKKYRRKNKPVMRRRVRKRKETPKETDEREVGDSQNSGLTAGAILEGNPSLPSSPAYLDNLESTSNLSPSQNSKAKNKVEEPPIRSENPSSQMNGSGNQPVQPDEKLRTDPNKPRSMKKGETFVENIPGKLIPENGAKILQPGNLLDTMQSQIDEKGGFLKQLEPPNTSFRIPDFIEPSLSDNQPVANNVPQEPIESKIPKKKKTRSPPATTPILDDAVKLENTQPQDRTDGEKSANSPLKKLQNIIARPQPSMDRAQQILKKVLPALEGSSNSTGQATTDPPITTEPYQSDGQIPELQKENGLEAGLKNASTGTSQPSASGTRAKKRMRVTEKDAPGIQSSPEPKTVGLEPQSVSTVDEPLLKNNKPRKRKQIVPPASLNIEGNEDTANEPQPKDGTNQHPPERRKSKKQTHEDLKEFAPQKAVDTPPTVEDLPTPTKPSVGKTRRKKPLEILEDILPAPEGTDQNSPTVNSITPSTSQLVKSKHRKKNEIIPEGSIIEEKTPSESPTTSDDPQKQRRKMRKPVPATEIDTNPPIAEQTDTTPRVEDLVEVPTSESSGNPILNKPSSTKRSKKPQQSAQLSPAKASTITPQPKPENISPPRKRRRIIDKVSPSPESETKADDGQSTPKIKQPMEEQLIDQQQSDSADRPANQEGVDRTPNLPQELLPVGPPPTDTHPKERRPRLKKVPSTLVNDPTTKPLITTAHEPIKDILTPTKNDEIVNLETTSTPGEVHPKKRRRLPDKVSLTPENGSRTPAIEVNNHEATLTSNAPPPVEKRRRMRETAPSSHIPKMEVDSQRPVVTIPNEAQPMQNQLADQYLNNAPIKATPDQPSTSDTQPKKPRQGLTKVLPDLVNSIVQKLENAGLEPTVDSPLAQRPVEDSSAPINNNEALNLQDTSPTPSEIHPKKRRRVPEKASPKPESDSNTPKVKGNNEEQPIANQLDQHDILIESAPKEPSTNDIRPKKRRQGLEKDLPDLANKEALEPEIMDSPILQQPEAFDLENISSIPSEDHPKKGRRMLEKVSPEPESSSNTPKVKVNKKQSTDNQLPDKNHSSIPKEAALDKPSTISCHPKKQNQGLQEVLPTLVKEKAPVLENAKHKPITDSPIAQRPTGDSFIPAKKEKIAQRPIEDSRVPINNNEALNLQDTSPTPSEIHPKKRSQMPEKGLPEPESDSNAPKVKGNNEEQPIGNQLTDQYQHDIPIESAPKEPSTNDIRPKKRRQGLEKDLPDLANKEALEPEIMDSPILQQPEAFDLENISSIPSEVHPKKGRQRLEKVSSEPEKSSNAPKVQVNSRNGEQPTDNQLTDENHSSIPKEAALDKPSTVSCHPKKQNQGLQEVLPTLVKEKAPEPENAKHKPITDSPTVQQPTGDSFIPAKKEKTPNLESTSKKRREKLEEVPLMLEDRADTSEVKIDGSPAAVKLSENLEQSPEKGPIVLQNGDDVPKIEKIDSNPEVGDMEVASDQKAPSSTLNKKTSSPLRDTVTAVQGDSTSPHPEKQQQALTELLPVHKSINKKAGPQITDHKPKLHSMGDTPKPKIIQAVESSSKDTKPTLKLKDKPTADKSSSTPFESPRQQNEFEEVLPATLDQENNGKVAQSVPTVLQKDDNAVVSPTPESTNTVSNSEEIPEVDDVISKGKDLKKKEKPKIASNLEKVASNPDLEMSDSFDKPTPVTSLENPSVAESTTTTPDSEHISSPHEPSKSDKKLKKQPLAPEVSPNLENKSNVPEQQEHDPKDMKPILKLKDKLTADKPSSTPIESPGQQNEFEEVLPATLDQENNTVPTVLQKDDNAIVAPNPESTNAVSNSEKIPKVDDVISKGKDPKKKEKPPKIASNLEKVASNPDREITDGKNEISDSFDKPTPVTSLENPSVTESTITTPDSKQISSPQEPSKSDKKLKKQPLAPEVSPNLENKSNAPEQQEHKEPKIELRKSTKPLSKSDHETPTKTVGNTDADLTKDSETVFVADTPTNNGEQMLENITPVKPEGDTDGLTPPTKQQKTSGKPKKPHQTNPDKGTDEIPVVDKVLSADEPSSGEIGSNEQPQLLSKIAENEDKLPEQKTTEVEDMLNAQEPGIDSNYMDPINVNQTSSLDNHFNPKQSNQPDQQQQQQVETNASPSKNIEGIPKPKIKDPGQKSSIVPHSKEQNPALKTADPVVKYVMNTPGTNNPQTGANPNTHESSPEKEESPGNETEIHNTSNPNQTFGGTSAEQDKINPDTPQTAENVIPPLRSDSSGSQPMDKVPTSEKKTHKSSEKSPSAAKPSLKPDANAMSDTVVPGPKEKKLKDKTDVPIRIENDEKPMESLTRVQNDILDSIPSPEVVEQISKEPNLTNIPEDKLSLKPDSREGSPTFEDLDSDLQNRPQTALPENLDTPDTTISSETDTESHKKTDSVDDPLLQKHVEPKINLDDDVEVFESNENKLPVSNEVSPLPEKNQEVLDSKNMDDGKPEDHFPNDRENSDPITPSILPTANGIPDEFYPLPEDGIASTDDKSPDAASEKILDSLTPKDDAENSLTESPITKGKPSDSGEMGSSPDEERTSQELADTARPPEDKSVADIEYFDPHPEETSSEFFSLNKLPDREPDEARPGPLEERTSSSNKPVETTPPKEFDETNVMPGEEETSSSEFFSLNKPSGPTPSQKFDESNPVRPEEEETSSSEFFALNKPLGMTPSRKSGGTNSRPDEDETSSSEFFSLNKPAGTNPSKKVGVTDSEPNEEETSSSEFFTLNKPAKTTPTRKIDEANSRPDGEEVPSEQATKFTSPEVGLEDETDSSPREDETPKDLSKQAQKLKSPKSLKPREHSDDTIMSTRQVNPSEPADELEEPREDQALHDKNQTEENEARTLPTDHESSGEYFTLNKLMNKVKPLASAIPFRGLDKNSIIPEGGTLSGVPHPTTLKAILKPTENLLFGESNKETTSPKVEDESGEFFSFDGKASKSRPSENEFLPKDFDKLDSNEERESVSNEVPSPKEQADTQVLRKPPEDAALFHETQRNMDDEHTKSDEEETYSEFFNLNDWVDKMHSSRHSGWFKEFEETSR